MSIQSDYYAILGVAKTADAGLIKKAYHRRAQQYHPNANDGDHTNAEKFMAAKDAYTVLSDPKKRMAYDKTRAQTEESISPSRSDSYTTGKTSSSGTTPNGDSTASRSAKPEPHNHTHHNPNRSSYPAHSRRPNAYAYLRKVSSAPLLG